MAGQNRCCEKEFDVVAPKVEMLDGCIALNHCLTDKVSDCVQLYAWVISERIFIVERETFVIPSLFIARSVCCQWCKPKVGTARHQKSKQ